MLSSHQPWPLWLYTALALTLWMAITNPLPTAWGQMLAVQGMPLIAFEDTGVATRIHSTKIAVGPDRKLYFNTALATVYRVDDDCVLEVVSVLPNAGGIPDDDFTVGITFDQQGELYVSNTTGVYLIRATDLQPDVLEQPVANLKIADIPARLQFPMGLVADAQGHLYLSDIFGGSIYKIDIATDEVMRWFSAAALLAPNVLPSNNMFGIGFGLTDLAIDPEGVYLYFGTQETHRIHRLPINPDGAPGQLEDLAHVPSLAFNGISFDMAARKIYLAVPWVNFESGIQIATHPVEIAGSIWAIDIAQMEAEGVATPVELIRDIDLGTVVDVVGGAAFGQEGAHTNRLYVSDGSFDTFFWPNGDPNGTPFPLDATPEAGFPFPPHPYHAAIRVLELQE